MSFGPVMQFTANDRVLPCIQLDRRHPTFEANEQIDIWLTYVLRTALASPRGSSPIAAPDRRSRRCHDHI